MRVPELYGIKGSFNVQNGTSSSILMDAWKRMSGEAEIDAAGKREIQAQWAHFTLEHEPFIIIVPNR